MSIDLCLLKLQEQIEKRHWLNAIAWCAELNRLLLVEFNNVLKGRS